MFTMEAGRAVSGQLAPVHLVQAIRSRQFSWSGSAGPASSSNTRPEYQKHVPKVIIMPNKHLERLEKSCDICDEVWERLDK